MKTVKFTQMSEGDKEDYELLANFEDKFIDRQYGLGGLKKT